MGVHALAHATTHDYVYDLVQASISPALPNVDLEELVYIEQPPGH